LPASGKRKERLIEGPLPATVQVVRSNLVYVESRDLPLAMLNRLLRLAAFQNPEFYKAQAMRLSTYDKPRVIVAHRVAPVRQYRYAHFGKTAIAAWLIAKRKVNTLVIVHRQQLLDQWVQDRRPRRRHPVRSDRVRLPAEDLHFVIKAFGDAIGPREAPHARDLLRPGVQGLA